MGAVGGVLVCFVCAGRWGCWCDLCEGVGVVEGCVRVGVVGGVGVRGVCTRLGGLVIV